MSKTSSKANARYLAILLKKHGCTEIVISPGSRNAPLIIAFGNDKDYNCISVPDERSAAFVALGKSMASGKPSAVICSSGSALVNYYPAVTEAFYQKLPLIILSADRPHEWIDQGIGQTIRQNEVFEKHICYSANLLGEPNSDLNQNFNQRQINEAMIASKGGPVHINIPLAEPLYDSIENPKEDIHLIESLDLSGDLNDEHWQSLHTSWNIHQRILVLAGQLPSDPDLRKSIEDLHQKSPFLVFSETLSNLHTSNSICSIDRLINTLGEEDKNSIKPDLLITIGGEIVSKMVKRLFRDKNIEHWHISESREIKDTFLNLKKIVPLKPQRFFEGIAKAAVSKSSNFVDNALDWDKEKSIKHLKFIEQSPFSDLLVISEVVKHLPKNSILHTANSASVRYTQLFDQEPSIEHYSNRGTSGIDGCSSTSLGFASINKKMLTLISGDVAFMYDSNAFWNDELPSNYRAIVVNNSGGNIFRIIKGPEKDANFEKFQETNHQQSVKSIAQRFSLSYQQASNLEELKRELVNFYDESEKPKILEVFTPRIESPEILQDYFRFLSLNDE